jgi:hypothetical protein
MCKQSSVITITCDVIYLVGLDVHIFFDGTQQHETYLILTSLNVWCD